MMLVIEMNKKGSNRHILTTYILIYQKEKQEASTVLVWPLIMNIFVLCCKCWKQTLLPDIVGMFSDEDSWRE